jgi:DNA-binding transcriptional MerR regulator
VKPKTENLYQPHEFAALAGVTVRALHHYHRLGLLKPTTRTKAGYRGYSERDLARLEQIVVLKFLGFSLREIGRLLEDDSSLVTALGRQRTVLAAKREQLERAIQAIAETEAVLQTAASPDWKLFSHIIKEIQMQNETDWTAKYYSAEAKEKIEQRKVLWSPELQERVSRDWANLFADIESSLNEDPASAKAQSLLARWRNLVDEFTGGDPEIQSGLNAMYSDQQNWPDSPRQRWAIRPEIQEFIRRAREA